MPMCAGNEIIHLMTNDRPPQELRIDMFDWGDDYKCVHYTNFAVDSESNMYNLSSLGHFSGSGSDAGGQSYCYASSRNPCMRLVEIASRERH